LNASKHKSIYFNSLLNKINSIKFNYRHRITKHTMFLFPFVIQHGDKLLK